MTDRDKLIELMQIVVDKGLKEINYSQTVGGPTYAELLADHLIENGIGDIAAETRKWDTLCNKIGDVIANGHDCEDGCWQEFLSIVNEIKRYDGSYYNQLDAEKQRADVAEEALRLACGDLSSYYYMTGAEALAENYIHQATERLKEKTK